MALESFAKSRSLTMGIELELQLVNLHDYDLVGAAPDLLRYVEKQKRSLDVKEEMTISMIEMATGICENHADALQQLSEIRDLLVARADHLNVGICGGGTHAFQHWGDQKISDKPRYNELSELYGYLAKQFTVFGQHVHIGCPAPDVALYVMHGIAEQVPGAMVHRDPILYDGYHHDIDIVAGSGLETLFPERRHGRVNSIHHQAIRQLGSDLRVEATAHGDGVIEAIRWAGNGYMVGCQWHPEFQGRYPDLLDSGPIMADFLAAARAATRD